MALQRWNLVLRLLVDQKVIDQELYDMLSARPLGVQPKGGVTFAAACVYADGASGTAG